MQVGLPGFETVLSKANVDTLILKYFVLPDLVIFTQNCVFALAEEHQASCKECMCM